MKTADQLNRELELEVDAHLARYRRHVSHKLLRLIFTTLAAIGWVLLDNETPRLIQYTTEACFLCFASLYEETMYRYLRADWNQFCDNFLYEVEEHINSIKN